MKLDDWLRTLIPAGAALPPAPVALDDDDENAAVKVDAHADLLAALEDGLPPDPALRSPEQRARALLVAALQFHRREERPAWWQLYEFVKAELDDLERASKVLLARAASASTWDMSGRMQKHRREVTVTGHDDARLVLEGGKEAFLLYASASEGMGRSTDSTRGFNKADIDTIVDDTVTLTERGGIDDAMWDDLPIAVLPGPPVKTDPIRNAIAAAANSIRPHTVGDIWEFPGTAWVDLLLSRAPRTVGGRLPSTGDAIDDICEALQDSSNSYVAVQGPPGTGKTYVGSRAVARLADQGWRIGVVAQSHAVVDNFLEAVRNADPTVSIGKEPQQGSQVQQPWHVKALAAWANSQPGGFVIGGTAWTFSRGSVQSLGLDLIVIDEAGQFALANAIACAYAARTVLLLGDPQQLPQVTQASHPEAMEASVLEHVIQGHATMPPDRGYFLAETYRMHPGLTEAVSRLQYEGRLGAADVTRLRLLRDVDPGLHPVPVDHTGNTTASPEEADAVVALLADLIGREWTGARDGGVEPSRPLEATDIIVVAAYNAQVRLLLRKLADAGFDDVAVGTVDKFQGREQVVVIVSMATSSDEDLPRGLDFLLSPNRLNVAISRAQWACFLVHSPELLTAKPSSIEGLRRLGSFLQLAHHS